MLSRFLWVLERIFRRCNDVLSEVKAFSFARGSSRWIFAEVVGLNGVKRHLRLGTNSACNEPGAGCGWFGWSLGEDDGRG